MSKRSAIQLVSLLLAALVATGCTPPGSGEGGRVLASNIEAELKASYEPWAAKVQSVATEGRTLVVSTTDALYADEQQEIAWLLEETLQWENERRFTSVRFVRSSDGGLLGQQELERLPTAGDTFDLTAGKQIVVPSGWIGEFHAANDPAARPGSYGSPEPIRAAKLMRIERDGISLSPFERSVAEVFASRDLAERSRHEGNSMGALTVSEDRSPVPLPGVAAARYTVVRRDPGDPGESLGRGEVSGKDPQTGSHYTEVLPLFVEVLIDGDKGETVRLTAELHNPVGGVEAHESDAAIAKGVLEYFMAGSGWR